MVINDELSIFLIQTINTNDKSEYTIILLRLTYSLILFK